MPSFSSCLLAGTLPVMHKYELRGGVLLAADYGAAQRRPRAILTGSRVGPVPLPNPTHARVAGFELDPWETVRSRHRGLARVAGHKLTA